MSKKPCMFCQVVKKEIPSNILYEDRRVIVISDINPAADYHFLVITKKHIPSLKEITEKNRLLLGHMLYVAKFFAKKKRLSGYKIVFNVGKKGGQMISHLHCHIISGKIKKWP